MRIGAVNSELIAQLSGKGASAFAGFRTGDSLQAEVVSVSGSSVTIRLDSGKVVAAAVRTDIALLAGDLIDLIVSEQTNKGVTLRMSSLNGQATKPIVNENESLVLRAGVALTPKNTAYANALQALSLPVRPQTLRAMDTALRAYPDLPIEQAAFMAGNSIEINEPNIKTVETWLQTAPLIDSIVLPVREYAEQAAPTAASLAASQPQENLAPQVALPDESAAQSSELLAQKSTPQTAQQPEGMPASAPTPQTVSTPGQTLSQRLAPFFSKQSDAALGAIKAAPDSEQTIARILSSPNAERGAASLDFLRSLPLSVPNNVKTEILSSLLGAPRIESLPAQAPTPLAPQADSGTAPADLPAAQAGSQPVVAKEKPDAPPAQTPPGTTDADGSRPAAFEKHPATKEEIKELVSNLFAKLLPGEPNAKELRRAAETSNEQLLALRDLLPTQESEPYRAVTQSLDQLIAQNKMGTELNNFYYAQLPFRLDEREQTAELYVLKREARRQLGKSSYTILMALSTETMGTVESVLKFDNTNLTLNLRVADEQAREFVTGRLDELRSLIASTRFRLQSVTVKDIDEPLSPMTVNRIAHNETGAALGGIDVSV